MLTDFRKRLVLVALLVLSGRMPAFAQGGVGAMEGTPVGDIGVKLSDTSILHVGVAAEGGYDSNVFYNDSQSQSSAVMQIVPSFNITNNGRDGKAHSTAVYILGANLTYREYINADQNIRDQRAFIPRLVGTLAVNGDKLTFNLGNSFVRSQEPPYYPTTMMGQPTGLITQDNNQANIGVGISPGGGRLTLTVRYSNILDYYETQYTFASNMTHDGLLDVSWKWLPKTALFLQGGASYIHFFNTSDPNMFDTRQNSTQVRGLAGLRGLITPKSTVNLQLGYETAFYSGGNPNPSGIANFSALLDIGYLATLLSRADLVVQHGFRNSPVIGNFYDTDSVALSYSHALGALVGGLHGSFEWRRYQNYKNAENVSVDRHDLLFGAGVSFDYFIQRWFYGGVTYQLTLDRPSNDPAAVAYTKHQVFARLGLAY
jgi:hypothetical protein